jgi:hypothetical protein
MYEDGTKIDDSCSTIAVCRSMEGTFALEGTQQTEILRGGACMASYTVRRIKMCGSLLPGEGQECFSAERSCVVVAV